MKILYLPLVILLLLLQACTTLTDSKTIVLTPERGQTTVVVESVAKSKCTDFFGLINCEILIDLHQAHRESGYSSNATNAAPAPAPVAAPAASVVSTPASPSDNSHKGTATQRLKELDEMHKNHMLSDDEYQKKRNQIVNEL